MNRRFVSTLTAEEQAMRKLAAGSPAELAKNVAGVAAAMTALSSALGEVSRLRRELDDMEERAGELRALAADGARAEQSRRFAGALLERTAARHQKSRATVKALNRRLAEPAAPGEVPDAVAGIRGLCWFASALVSPPCVYFLLSGGEVVYVGQTESLLQRIADHYAGGEGKCFDAVFYLPLRPDQLAEVERVMIARFAPRLNVSRPACRDGETERICRRFGLTD